MKAGGPGNRLARNFFARRHVGMSHRGVTRVRVTVAASKRS
jgi:hypothetical protein